MEVEKSHLLLRLRGLLEMFITDLFDFSYKDRKKTKEGEGHELD
jgi:hypothetical protein